MLLSLAGFRVESSPERLQCGNGDWPLLAALGISMLHQYRATRQGAFLTRYGGAEYRETDFQTLNITDAGAQHFGIHTVTE
jgi:hypothetical protein